MKKRIIKSFDRLLLVLLGLIGVLTGCSIINPIPVEYGTPHADYEFKGTVTDSLTATPVQNARIIISQTFNEGDLIAPHIDTLALKETDSNGKYDILIQNYPPDGITFHVNVVDIDGTANGGDFVSQEKDVVFNQSDLTGGKSWYDGKGVKVIDFKLKKK
jgi:putative lipoprotein (rSAM/lipoprotein system)